MTAPGSLLVARPCDFCGVRALCVPIVDHGDGAVLYACGRCSSSGETTKAPRLVRTYPTR